MECFAFAAQGAHKHLDVWLIVIFIQTNIIPEAITSVVGVGEAAPPPPSFPGERVVRQEGCVQGGL